MYIWLLYSPYLKVGNELHPVVVLLLHSVENFPPLLPEGDLVLTKVHGYLTKWPVEALMP
jgi:hypothetical protein